MKKILVLLIISLLVFSVLNSPTIFNIGLIGAASATLSVPTQYNTIQAAINAASDGDTVYVGSGTYYENVIVNKRVSLVGEKKENTVIDGGGTGPVIHITAADVGVGGFTIQNASEMGMLSVGIFIEMTTGSNIIGNIMRTNWIGVYLDRSSGSTVRDNMMVNNTYGIYLSQSGRNNFDHNTALDNRYGFVISLYGSGSNILRNNNMSRNSQNFKLFTVLDASSLVQDIDNSNTVDGKPIYYWMNQRDKQVPTGAGYVAIINSINVTVKDVVTTKNGQGVLFINTSNSTIDNVNASNNIGGDGIVLSFSSNNYIFRSTMSNNLGSGIRLDMSNDNVILGNRVIKNSNGIVFGECTNNLIYGNEISNNTAQGIYTFNSDNNTVYHNSFISNAIQVSSEVSWNSWDGGYPSGGNFWSDFSGTDANSGPYQNMTGSDEIGDSPYIIDANNTDRYPLMASPRLDPAFVISASPVSEGVKPGQSITYTVTVVSAFGFSSEVRLNGTLNPSSNNITFAFNPETVVPPLNGSEQSVLTVTAIPEAVPATFVITVNATYNEYYATDRVEVKVLDIVKPTAEAGLDKTVDEDTEVTFDGSGSSDNVGIVDYTWTFVDVDLQALTGVHPTYVFDNPGKYVVTLNVTDAAGNWATDDVAITVLDVTNPVADAGQNQTVQLGASVTLDGRGSTDNVGIVSYEWDFGDGNLGTEARVTHTYLNVGTYNVTLAVEDAAGNSDTDWVVVTVTAGSSNGLLFPMLVAAGGIAVVGFVLGLLYWRIRKRQLSSPSIRRRRKA